MGRRRGTRGDGGDDAGRRDAVDGCGEMAGRRGGRNGVGTQRRRNTAVQERGDAEKNAKRRGEMMRGVARDDVETSRESR